MCLRRGDKDQPFELHEVRVLESLAPHMSAGLRAASSRSAVASAAGKATGVVVLGPDGKIDVANGVAERLFRQPVNGTRQLPAHRGACGRHPVGTRVDERRR